LGQTPYKAFSISSIPKDLKVGIFRVEKQARLQVPLEESTCSGTSLTLRGIDDGWKTSLKTSRMTRERVQILMHLGGRGDSSRLHSNPLPEVTQIQVRLKVLLALPDTHGTDDQPFSVD
jgi:hypothetical protein